MPGDLTIDAFSKATGLTLASEHSEPVAGLMLEHLGRMPRVGDHASVGAVTFTVEAAEDLVITRVRARPNAVLAGPTEAS